MSDLSSGSGQVEIKIAMKRGRKPEKSDNKTVKFVPPYKYRALPVAAPVVISNLLPSVALSEYDKASQLTLSKDQLSVFGCEVDGLYD